jgi:DNA-binding beta-propeller fold protein YncE
MPGVKSRCNGVAVTRDGSTLLALDCDGGSHAIHEFVVADGSRRRVVGTHGNGPLQFSGACQLWIASDDYVFVADCGNNRVQVLTPSLDFDAIVGAGQLSGPAGVCANDDVIVVSEYSADRVTVFARGDHSLLYRFGASGRSEFQLHHPCGLCFLSGNRHIALADCGNDRVSVFSLKGGFIRHVGVGTLSRPCGVVCSAFDELVVADYGNKRVSVFSASGELLEPIGRGDFTGVALHGGTIFAPDYDKQTCAVKAVVDAVLI